MNGFVHIVLRKIISPFKRTGLLWVLFEIFYKLSTCYRLGIKTERKEVSRLQNLLKSAVILAS